MILSAPVEGLGVRSKRSVNRLGWKLTHEARTGGTVTTGDEHAVVVEVDGLSVGHSLAIRFFGILRVHTEGVGRLVHDYCVLT